MSRGLLLMLFLLLQADIGSAYSLDSSAAIPNRIFKCQPSMIYANLSGAAAVTDIYVNINRTVMLNGSPYFAHERYQMVPGAGSQWTYQYGNNASIVYGNKSIAFQVYEGVAVSYNETATYVIVYSDPCTGTGMQSWRNVTQGAGLGNYTKRLFQSDMSLIEFMIYPWVQYWGYVFYIIIIFGMCVMVYMKTQVIMYPLFIALTSLGALALGSTTSALWLPAEWRQYVIMLLGVCVGAIIYRIYKG